ncbi:MULTISPECIES: dihydroorotase [Halolamina]|uniref:Dihydroorotase n=1 Tax=Halolamina pelagica TaxID=699431 RepID=A0A1I5UDQ7_9EURY|nr:MULTISPECIES: dihydroorotase [Halolamina]NHX37242.1 dihydroorotase [Halolamina sp. R1-12]SFP93420.1 dihydroorotase [Halolamina pelagica]
MLITGAELPDGRVRDVRTDEGRIAEIAESLHSLPGEETVDATGLTLLPGAIDVHVHFRQPGHGHKETWATGSRSAAAGGVTTVVDQPNTTPPTVDGTAFDEKAEFAANAAVNYGINGGVNDEWDPDSLLSRPVFALGEVFLADSTGDMGIDEELFGDALAEAADAGVTVTVHAEDADRFDESARDGDAGGTGREANADLWSQYRTAEAEIAAVEAACEAAADAGVDIHVAHTSTPEAAEHAAEAGMSTEVTPHHLLLSREDLDELGTFGRMNPPLRSEARREELYDFVVDGTVDVIATDHAPHTTAEKEAGLWDAPSGVPGVETMLPLLLGEVRDGDLPLERVVELVAATPAERFDLDAKGRVEEGYDADLTLVDLDDAEPIRADALHTKCDWTPFEGREAVFPELTVVDGSVVYDGRAGDRFTAGLGRNVRE